jgi:protein involved in polysaccharide export with SLBB domain
MRSPLHCTAALTALSLFVSLGLGHRHALAQPAPVAPPAGAAAATSPTPSAAVDSAGVTPFGASLFTGNFAGQRDDGLNEDYQVLPGDRVMVNVWGSATVNDVFVVDAQGNIFLPGVGPVRLSGVRARDLTGVVRGEIARRYRGTFEVYTNLLTASPVAVFVTGAVPRPGRYAGIPSDSVLVFLDQAGGVDARTGSYRSVQVLREGQPVASSTSTTSCCAGPCPRRSCKTATPCWWGGAARAWRCSCPPASASAWSSRAASLPPSWCARWCGPARASTS